MPKKLSFRELPVLVGTYRLNSEYDGPKPRPGMHVFIECTKCGDATRILPAYLWNAAAKGKQALSCPHCRQGNPRAKKTAKLYVHNGLSLTLPEWAERTGMNLRAMYARSKNRDALPHHLRQNDDYVIFGGNVDHPLRHLSARPVRAVDKVLTMLEERVSESLRASVSRIANSIVQDELRPVLLDLLTAGILQAGSVQAEDTSELSIPEGQVRSLANPKAFHDPNRHHPHDANLIGLNTTLLQYRREVGDDEAISRWDYIEDLRMEDSDFSNSEVEKLLREPLLREDMDRIKAEEDARIAAEEAERQALKDAKIEAEREAARIENEKWRIHCAPGDVQYARISDRTYYDLPERCRIPGGQLPIAQGHTHQEPRDGSFLTRQGDAPPALTDEYVRKHYLSTPWWVHRTKFPFLEYGLEFVCRTQYERIVAFYRWTPTKGSRESGRLLCDPTATWVKTHMDLNLYMDLEALLEWPTNRKHLDESLYPRIKSAYVEGIEHPSSEIQQLARDLASKFPQLGLQPEDSL